MYVIATVIFGKDSCCVRNWGVILAGLAVVSEDRKHSKRSTATADLLHGVARLR
jgi:hypothetical protein